MARNNRLRIVHRLGAPADPLKYLQRSTCCLVMIVFLPTSTRLFIIVLNSVSLTRVVSNITMMKMRQLYGKEYCRLILYVFRILTETSIYNI